MKLPEISENARLGECSTMRLGGRARYLAEARTEDDVAQLSAWAAERSLPIITVGGGSNIVWKDEGFSGLVIVNKLSGKEIIEEDEQSVTVRLAAGENWDGAVAWAVDRNYSGIEALSLIPGTVGATPVQNVEAYGQAIADTLVEVELFDTKTQVFEGMLKDSCELDYRSSRFKAKDHGRYIICAVVLKLHKHTAMQPPFHRGLQAYVDENKITDFSPANIRKAVIAIRSAKLPDPAKVANNGSFFKNPIIEAEKSEKLKEQFPDILNYPAGGKVKLSAQWLIEHAGFSAGYEDKATGMALWPKHALVFVNQHAKTTADLMAFRQKIIDAVKAKFNVTLEQEPELLP